MFSSLLKYALTWLNPYHFSNVGFDLKYGLSSNLTLDATINPDFGQVELDRPVLNLSAFEIRFEEKRPFFLEGANMFSTPFMLFYSRRIGRTPRMGVDDPKFAYYTDYPKSTTILGAAKITGKLANGTSISFLNAVTEEELAEYVAITTDTTFVNDSVSSIDTVATHTSNGLVEPKAAYSVLRLQQDVLSNSQVGLILTHVGQDGRTPAVTGGLDWRLATSNGVWNLNGQTVFSRVDDQYIGFGFTGSVRKAAGKHWRGSIGGTIKDPHLHINRLGYTSRNNMRRVYSWIQYRTSDDWFIFRNTYHNFNTYMGWNYSGDNIEKGWNYNTFLQFTNNWRLGAGFNQNLDQYDDFETRGLGLWRQPASWSWWASFRTDSRRMISLNLNPGSGYNRYGTWWAHYTGIEIRPQSNMEFGVGVNYRRGFGQTRWLTNQGDRPVFADLDQDEVSLSLSASVMFHRNLSFQISGRGYITGLDYANYRYYLGGEEYGDHLEPVDFDDAYDRNFSALNSTMIIRWEYLPGSTLYLVWTRSRPETDHSVNDLKVRRDLDRLFSHGSSNIWLVKASYWWNI